MNMLIAGLILFLGVHSIAIVAPDFRERARRRLGEGAWNGLYGILSLVGFVLIVHGFALSRAAPTVLYTPPTWLRYITFLLMLPVFPLLFAAYLPGKINTAVKHPLLAAVKLWAFAHLLSNGHAADSLLFGGFLAWAVVDRISLKRRPRPAPRTAAPGRWNDAIAVLLGLATYALVLLWAHSRLFGISPLA